MNPIFDHLIHAVETNDLPKWQSHYQMLSIEEKEQIVQQDNYHLFHLAASKGQFEIFEDTISAILNNIDESYIIDRLNDAFSARAGEGLRNALKYRHAEIVKEFLIGSLEESLYTESLSIILEESNFIEYICTLSLKGSLPDLLKLACLTNLKAVELVLSIVSLEEILQLLEIQIKRSVEESNNIPLVVLAWLALFVNATRIDDAQIIQYLWQKVPVNAQKTIIYGVFPECFIHAAKNGSFKALLSMSALLTHEELHFCLKYEDYNTFVYSADRGNLEMLKWVWNNLANSEKPLALSASGFAAFKLAKQNNHQDIIAFLMLGGCNV